MPTLSSRVPRVCERCGLPFTIEPNQAARGGGRFCSRQCRYTPRPLIPHPDNPLIMLVPLTRGKFAVIDAEDAPLVSGYSWCACVFRPGTDKERWYAMARDPDRVNRQLYLHRVIVHAPEGVPIDHGNRDGLDCRKQNLRRCTTISNHQNTVIPVHNTSGYKGVSWCRLTKRWAAQVRIDGKQVNLGRFATKEDAARAYDAAARELHGDFARLNFPGPGERSAR